MRDLAQIIKSNQEAADQGFLPQPKPRAINDTVWTTYHSNGRWSVTIDAGPAQIELYAKDGHAADRLLAVLNDCLL